MIPLVFGLALMGSAQAVEPQYRQLRLVDGRVLTGQILATESDGLSLELPQGRALVPFDLLVDMLPTDALTYREQPDWSVWVVAEEPARGGILAAFSAVEGVRATPVGDGAPDPVAAASRACGTDLNCVALASNESGWRWLVVAEQKGSGELRITSRTNGLNDATTVNVVTPLARIDQHVHELIGLQRPVEPPPSIAVDPVATVPEDATKPEAPRIAKSDRRKVLLESFVPLPGYPSLRRGDTGGMAAALGIVVPATAVWVGAVGQGSQNATELTVLSLAGFYGATVLTNQVMGQRTLKKQSAALSFGPTERGGTQILIGARF
ncbi:MAG: hypothetical protein AAGA48_20195 [Myxococcota bacterium]